MGCVFSQEFKYKLDILILAILTKLQNDKKTDFNKKAADGQFFHGVFTYHLFDISITFVQLLGQNQHSVMSSVRIKRVR